MDCVVGTYFEILPEDLHFVLFKILRKEFKKIPKGACDLYNKFMKDLILGHVNPEEMFDIITDYIEIKINNVTPLTFMYVLYRIEKIYNKKFEGMLFKDINKIIFAVDIVNSEYTYIFLFKIEDKYIFILRFYGKTTAQTKEIIDFDKSWVDLWNRIDILNRDIILKYHNCM